MIPRETVDRVFSAAKIEEVVGDYVSLKKRGANMIGLCPFHTEKTGSFTVSPSKGIFKCFGCGKSGHAVGFVMEIEQCGFADAVRQIAKKYNIEVEEREMTDEERQHQDDRESMFVVNEFANKWFQDQLWNTEEGRIAGLQYFRERGLTDQTIREYGLGYSPEKGNPLSIALKKHGFNEKYIVQDPNAKERKDQPGTGLCGQSEDGRTYDRFRGRVMFPIHTVSGKIVAFAGRIIKKNDKVGKYVNSPDSIIYSKTNELYGMFLAKQAIAREDLCYMVEGQMDVISMHQAGIHNVVCSGGTALTTAQIRLIHRFTNNITVIYDGDAAGIHAALRGIDMFLEEGFAVKVLLLPNGEDPDSFAQSHNASDFIQYIKENEVDFIRFKIRLLSAEASDPNKRSELIRDIVQSIAQIPDPITRQVYIQDAADRLKMTEDLLTKTMNRMRDERRDEERKKREIKAKQEEERELSEAVATGQNQPAETAQISRLEQNYLNLLRIIVRYGEREYIPKEMSYGDYIYAEVSKDCVAPKPLYQLVIDEFLAHEHDANFVSELFFKTHPNPEISALSISLITEEYQLSTIYNKRNITENVQKQVKQEDDGDRLPTLVNHLIGELRYTIVEQRLDEISRLQREYKDNQEYQMQLLAAQAQLIAYKQNLSATLRRG